MASPTSNDRSPPQAPPTLPPSSLRATGSATSLHDLLNFPSPAFDPAPRPPPHTLPFAQAPALSYYSAYPAVPHAGHSLEQHHHVAHPSYPHPPGVASSSALPPLGSKSYQPPHSYSFDGSQPAHKKVRRDSIPSSLTSQDESLDPHGSASQTPVPQSLTAQQQQQQLEVVDVPDDIIAGLAGRQLTEKKRKWRAKAGVQGPGKSWRKGLKDADRPPPPPPPPPPPEPAYIAAVEDLREGHPLEPDWKSPLPPKKRKELTEKNRSRFVASAPAVKYNQAWITAEPLLNKGEAKTTPVRQWKVGRRMVRSITGKQWVSKNGWVGDTESPLATLIQEQKTAAAQAAAAALPPSLLPQSVAVTQPTSAYGTPAPDGTPAPMPLPVPMPAAGPGQGQMPHEKHRLYALARESEAGGSTSREGSVMSVGSDGTGF